MDVHPSGKSCMTAHIFVDANVFVYAKDPCERLKQPIAAAWIENLWKGKAGRTSMQALNECYSVLTRKVRPPLSHDVAWEHIKKLMGWDPRPVDSTLAVSAREIEQRYGLNWWDCLIIAAAQAERCSILLTEDLQDRAVYGNVSVRNPFAPAVCDSALPQLYGADRAFALRSRLRGRRIRPRPSGTTGAQVGL